jgi:site-specific recombinase XerD
VQVSRRKTSGSTSFATFATWALWNGVDLRTVQQWLGHSDMESTMRYLKPSRSQQVRDKVNEIFA